MLEVSKAVCNKNSLKAWTVITDCLSHGGETPFFYKLKVLWSKNINKYKDKNKCVI
jgi:hypothetical protein